jgi:hypothetical protein
MKTDFGPGYADFFELTVNATPQRLIEVVKDIYRKGRIDQIIDPLR